MREHPEYPSMARPAVLTVFVLVIVAALVLIAGYATNLWPGMSGPVSPTPVTFSPTPTGTHLNPGVTPAGSEQSCTTDDDCVPVECCHPASCENRAYKHVCNLMCTNVCSGPIDCGAGSCGCVNGTCAVRSASLASSSPFATVARNL